MSNKIFLFQHTLFVVIFGLFVIWQVLKNGYLLFNIFGWNWLAWIGFLLALFIAFVVFVGELTNRIETIKRKGFTDEHLKPQKGIKKVEE